MHKVTAVLSITSRRRFQNFDVAQLIELFCIRIFLGICIVHAVHFRGFDDDIRVDFRGAQCRGGIRGKKRIAGARAEDHHASFFEVADGASADIGFGHGAHLDG